MSKLAALLLMLFPLASLSADSPLKGLKIKRSGFSHELELLTAHLEASKALPLELAQETIGAAVLINNDLKKTPKTNALFLIKSEIYKGMLNNQRLSHDDQVLVTEAMVKSMEKKLQEHSVVYSDFSKWIMASTLAELAPFRSDGFLDRHQTISRKDLKEGAKAFQLKKRVKYLSPWIIAFNQKTPEDFNQLVSLVSADLLKQISKKTFYFKEFSSKHSKDSFEELFEIPAATALDKKSPPMPETSLEKESAKRVEEVEKVLDTLGNEELENPSEAINILLEDEKPGAESGGWKPK